MLAAPKATITLRIHPHYGQEVRVIRAYGPNALWVEAEDGTLNILPAAWTDLRPRVDLSQVSDRAVRLAPEAAKELAAYVAAQRGDGRPDDSSSRGPTKGETDVSDVPAKKPAIRRAEQRERRAAGKPRGRRGAPAAVVGEAGAPQADRGARRGAR